MFLFLLLCWFLFRARTTAEFENGAGLVAQSGGGGRGGRWVGSGEDGVLGGGEFWGG